MEQFRKLEPEIRTLALVGGFLQRWALMEAKLNDVLVKSLGLGNLSGVIVARNIQLRDKTKIVKTAIELSYFSEKSDKDRYKKLIDRIAEYSTKRNILAHECFCNSGDGEHTDFIIIKANGKLDFPDEKWSIDDFRRHFEAIDGFYDELETLLKKLNTSAITKSLMEALTREPSQSLSQLGLGGLLSPQPLMPLGSIPTLASPETAAETPPRRRREPKPRKVD